MPRDLTDLMEQATSFAPAEPHDAAAITRLAADRQRRRTASIAGGLALVVVVAGVAGYGVTRRGDDSTPEPAGRVRLGQQVGPDDAVPATSVRGYRELHYAVPPVDGGAGTRHPIARYADIDETGRLAIERQSSGLAHADATVDILDGPDSTKSSVTPPASPGTNGTVTISWIPSFVGDGRILWSPSAAILDKARSGSHLSALDGSHDLRIDTDFSASTPGYGLHELWVAGNRVWFEQREKVNLNAAGGYSLYSAPITDTSHPTVVATHLDAADVSDDTVAWVTGDGRIGMEAADGSARHTFAVPFDEGCGQTSGAMVDVGDEFSVTAGLVALSERCGKGKDALDTGLVLDASGRQVLRVTGMTFADPSLSGTTLGFVGITLSGAQQQLHVDLTTDVLSVLGPGGDRTGLAGPITAGRYVLWYDHSGGHVAEFTG
jgi:hypothetical protein